MAIKLKLKVEKNRLPGLPDAVRARVGRALRATAFNILGDAQGRAPVDTGFLRNSGRADFPTEGVAEIGFAAEYAEFVELGTRNQAAQPFLAPASDAHRSSFIEAVKEAVREGVE